MFVFFLLIFPLHAYEFVSFKEKGVVQYALILKSKSDSQSQNMLPLCGCHDVDEVKDLFLLPKNNFLRVKEFLPSDEEELSKLDCQKKETVKLWCSSYPEEKRSLLKVYRHPERPSLFLSINGTPFSIELKNSSLFLRKFLNNPQLETPTQAIYRLFSKTAQLLPFGEVLSKEMGSLSFADRWTLKRAFFDGHTFFLAIHEDQKGEITYLPIFSLNGQSISSLLNNNVSKEEIFSTLAPLFSLDSSFYQEDRQWQHLNSSEMMAFIKHLSDLDQIFWNIDIKVDAPHYLAHHGHLQSFMLKDVSGAEQGYLSLESENRVYLPPLVAHKWVNIPLKRIDYVLHDPREPQTPLLSFSQESLPLLKILGIQVPIQEAIKEISLMGQYALASTRIQSSHHTLSFLQNNDEDEKKICRLTYRQGQKLYGNSASLESACNSKGETLYIKIQGEVDLQGPIGLDKFSHFKRVVLVGESSSDGVRAKISLMPYAREMRGNSYFRFTDVREVVVSDLDFEVKVPYGNFFIFEIKNTLFKAHNVKSLPSSEAIEGSGDLTTTFLKSDDNSVIFIDHAEVTSHSLPSFNFVESVVFMEDVTIQSQSLKQAVAINVEDSSSLFIKRVTTSANNVFKVCQDSLIFCSHSQIDTFKGSFPKDYWDSFRAFQVSKNSHVYFQDSKVGRFKELCRFEGRRDTSQFEASYIDSQCSTLFSGEGKFFLEGKML